MSILQLKKISIFFSATETKTLEGLEKEQRWFDLIVDLKIWEKKFRQLMDQPAWQKLLEKCIDVQETFNPNFVRWEGGEEGNVPVENDRVDRHTYFKFMTNLCTIGN